MWCGRKNCRNQADHAKFMADRHGGNSHCGSSGSNNTDSSDSKMKAAMVFEEDL